MTIIELFNNYWKVNRTDPMPPMCAALYFYLLHECNIRRWINPFELRTKQIELELDLTRKIINDSRNTLKQRGLIDFQNGKGKAPARYNIVGVKSSSKPSVVSIGNDKRNNKAGVVPGVVSIGNDKRNNKRNNKVTTNDTTQQFPPISIEDIKTKDKRHIPPYPQGGGSASGVADGILDFGDEPKKKPARIKNPPPPTPTLADVKKYYLSQNADKRLADWQTEAEIFFNNYEAVGWIDANRRVIRNWESQANKWIFKKEDQEAKYNAKNTLNRSDHEADGRQQRREDIANYVFRNISNNGAPPGDESSDLPF